MSETKKSAAAVAEEHVLDKWKKDATFDQTVKQSKDAPLFVFNDGPPFANGLPHFGHSLVTAIKDSILRYKTMQGIHVPRRNGWDCHGLPVEFSIEKEFGISGKKQIEELGIEKFNAACRASIFKFKADWERFLQRYGRWSDYEHYYATVDRDYTESVWWILSEIHKKGLLYRGLKSVPYCPRCQTPLSNFELNEGYKDDVPDPSVFALFPLKDDSNTKLLAWTTTPWTLPANAALAIDSKADYAYVELKSDGSTVILAKTRLGVLDIDKHDYKLSKTVKGSELVGLRYEPLYPLPEANYEPEQVTNAHQVFADNSVSLEDGTGILHVAPRYGETDLNLGIKENLPLIESVDSAGHLVYGPEDAIGKFYKSADEPIIADLTHKGKIFAAESNFKHTYPFCWRCDTPLMYFATNTWFVEVSKIRQQMVKTAEQINWVPANIKTGRWGKWLEGARDWAISRNRYWGAPMPIWQNVDDENDYIVVESIAQLKELAGSDIEVEDLHRPFVDKIEFTKDGKTYKRVEEVLDCWFESGSMPVAQHHYPFENKEETEKNLTADFITEAIDQTRLWFYVQHVISTILFDKPAFKQVIVTGFIMAADGQKLSKRLKNYPPVEDVLIDEGADAWRLYLLSSTQATETADYMRFDRQGVRDMKRNIIDTLNNSYRFFDTYSKLDKWQPPMKLEEPQTSNLLDQWILARTNQTITASTKSADSYKIAHAVLPIFDLIDDMSNWYIRRSRKRFWKSENDSDKTEAYNTLWYVMLRVSQLMAPWAPFISDELWQNLTSGAGQEESVHLSKWPSVKEPDNASQKLLEEMSKVREIITQGLAQRAEAKVKVRQPLSSVFVTGVDEQFYPLIAEELNVKEVKSGSSLKLDTSVTPELKREGIARDLIRSVQNARKNAGLNVEDRILIKIDSGSTEIIEAVKNYKDTIFAETLATGELSAQGQHAEAVKIDGQEVKIELSGA